MRRITLWLTSTAAILVLLFSYRTSTMGAGGAALPAIASGLGNTDTSGGGPDATSASPTSRAPAKAPPSAPSSTARSAADPPTTKATSPAAPAPSTAPVTAVAKVVTGQTVSTRWGPVQVAITVKNKRITAVAVPVYPSGNNRDAEINSFALPVLVHETLTAQSAQIDVVSGASVTSDGYISSLQSAIDAAHL